MGVKIRLTPSGTGYETDIDYGMAEGIEVIETTNEYILIHYTIDGDYVEIFKDFEDLLKRLEEDYGDEIRQAVLDAFKEVYGDQGVKEMLNNE